MLKNLRDDKSFRTNAKLVVTIIPVVVVMIFVFLAMTRNKILNLSKDKMSLETKNCAEKIDIWTEQTLSELNIYKNLIEKNCTNDEETLKILRASYGVSNVYPIGLYAGDENGVYLDGSDWVPGDDFVVAERTWYKEGLTHNKLAFGEPYIDAQTGDVCVSATALVNYKPAKTVMSADIYVNYASSIVKSAAMGIIENAFIVSGDSSIVLADGKTEMSGQSINKEDTPLLYSNINDLVNKHLTGSFKTIGDDGKYYVCIDKLMTNDWYLVTYMSWGDILKEMRRMETIMSIIGTAVSILLIFMTRKIAKEMSSIRKKAQTDPLTRLLNRNGFREQVMLSLENDRESGILLMIDMDNFKLINDQLGHPEGDEVLKRFSGILDNYFNRNKDIVARIGGDEFAVYVGRNIESPETEAMLRKFINVFHDNFDESYPKQKLSVSIGGSYVRSCGGVYEDLYQKADNAMYEVKKNGKNNFIIL